jgi:hypothetical protein
MSGNSIASRLGWLVGFPLLGIATFRASVLPRWCGLLLIAYPAIFFLIFFFVDRSGAVRALFGPYWLAVGYALWFHQDEPVQPARVS